MTQADIAMIGLAVMGQNLVMNMADHGFTVAVYNRTTAVVDSFVAGPAKGMRIIPTHSLEELVATLKRPRRVMMLVKAGQPVDAFIERLIPILEPGDIIIDGGNSNYEDTMRRTSAVEARGLLYIGAGVSGGEEGARHGPSIMPGGSPAAWPAVKPILQAIAAKAPEGDPNGVPCCDWVGENGAGHFVKMVHNGIEYGDMQLIAEAYSLLRAGKESDNAQLATVFDNWNKGDLDSFLIEITANILRFKQADGTYLVDSILDVAGQKGTGKWSAMAAMDQNDPLTLVTEAVYARMLSGLQSERQKASALYPGQGEEVASLTTNDIRDALYASKIISYAQGFSLMSRASASYKWNLNYGAIAQIWRKGCIIRSAFLGKITEAYQHNPELENLLFDPFFKQKIENSQSAWRKVVSAAFASGVAIPAMASALSYFDGLRTLNSSANLIQAQRDYFGAHTYERTDSPRGQFFHTDWTGKGGSTHSGNYNV